MAGTTSTILHVTTTTVAHTSTAAAATNAWIAVAAAATAVFTAGFMTVAFANYLHDLATSGTRKPVIAKRVRSTWRLEGDRQIPIPKEYQATGRIIAVRFVNRAPTTEVISVRKVSLWFGPESPTVHDSGTLSVTDVNERAFLIGISHTDWPDRARFWATVTFETKNGDRFRYWGYLRFWPLP